MKERQIASIFLKETLNFNSHLEGNLNLRVMQELREKQIIQEINEEKKKRQDAKTTEKKHHWRIRK